MACNCGNHSCGFWGSGIIGKRNTREDIFLGMIPLSLVCSLQTWSPCVPHHVSCAGWWNGTQWGAVPSGASLSQDFLSCLSHHFLSLLHGVNSPPLLQCCLWALVLMKKMDSSSDSIRAPVLALYSSTFRGSLFIICNHKAHPHIHSLLIHQILNKYGSASFLTILKILGILWDAFNYFIHYRHNIFPHLKYNMHFIYR